jgi:hypothetical protein
MMFYRVVRCIPVSTPAPLLAAAAPDRSQRVLPFTLPASAQVTTVMRLAAPTTTSLNGTSLPPTYHF